MTLPGARKAEPGHRHGPGPHGPVAGIPHDGQRALGQKVAHRKKARPLHRGGGPQASTRQSTSARRHAEARYQHQRARRFEFVMEALLEVQHASVRDQPLIPYIEQAGERKMIMAAALREVEQLRRSVALSKRAVVGRWAPALFCPRRDVTRAGMPGSVPRPKAPGTRQPPPARPGDGPAERQPRPRETPARTSPNTPPEAWCRPDEPTMSAPTKRIASC